MFGVPRLFGRTFEEHLSHLLLVLERLRQFGLKAKLSKCNFLQKKVLYLGHIISPEGIATDPSKTQRIIDWPTPCNVKEVQQFLGLASYYRRFIQRFAEIAWPLHHLTERGRDFKWTTEFADTFAKLKFCLHSSPILAYPDLRYLLYNTCNRLNSQHEVILQSFIYCACVVQSWH